MTNDIRWVQRFQHFEKAYLMLRDSCNIEEPTPIEEAGIIQVFEFTFELAWKTMKDLLELDGFLPKSPRDVIKLAFQTEWLKDGEIWLEALEKRNLMAHSYDEAKAKEAIALIRTRYSLVLAQCYVFLLERRK